MTKDELEGLESLLRFNLADKDEAIKELITAVKTAQDRIAALEKAAWDVVGFAKRATPIVKHVSTTSIVDTAWIEQLRTVLLPTEANQ